MPQKSWFILSEFLNVGSYELLVNHNSQSSFVQQYLIIWCYRNGVTFWETVKKHIFQNVDLDILKKDLDGYSC